MRDICTYCRQRKYAAGKKTQKGQEHSAQGRCVHSENGRLQTCKSQRRVFPFELFSAPRIGYRICPVSIRPKRTTTGPR